MDYIIKPGHEIDLENQMYLKMANRNHKKINGMVRESTDHIEYEMENEIEIQKRKERHYELIRAKCDPFSYKNMQIMEKLDREKNAHKVIKPQSKNENMIGDLNLQHGLSINTDGG